MKLLRDYQKESVNAIINFTGYGGLIVLPTGSGKSLVIADACKQYQGKVLVLAHRAELIDQNSKEFSEYTNEPYGIWGASFNQKTRERITFAQIQSAYKDNWIDVDLVVVDEAHSISLNESSMYQQLLENCKGQLIGLTATPHRLDSGHLVRGNSSLFSKVIYEAKYDDLVEQGYLASMRYRAEDGIDNEDFNLKTGEIDLTQVEYYLEPKLKKILEDAKSKQIGKTLWFCPTVDIAEKVATEINGVSVTGNTLNRADILADFKAGKIKDITNVEVLTTGFNAPDLETLVFLRPTKSTALFKQMLGRGTRLAENKTSCLVLDYTTNTMCHGFLGDDTYPNAKKKSYDYKECLGCGEIVKIGVKECPECGFVWEARPRGERKPLESLSVVSFDPNAEWIVDLKKISAELYFKNKYTIQINMKVTGGTVRRWLPITGFFLKQFLGKLGIRDIETTPEDWRVRVNALILAVNKCKLPGRVLVRKNKDNWFEFIDFL